MKKHVRCLVLVATGALLISCSDPIGTHYRNVDAVGMAEEWSAWVVVGRFGPLGPFTLTDVMRCKAYEACSFSHNGQGHTYDGFDGFELAVLQLENPQGEVSHVVLRSLEKVDNR